MESLLGMAAVVVVGLLVGVEVAVAVFLDPILDRLPHDGALAARSDSARVLGRVMPFWYIGSIALSVGWAWVDREWASVTASALLVAAIVMTITLLVPINTRVGRWSAESAPADWRNQLRRWDKGHQLRVAVIALAFLGLVWSGRG